MRIAREFDFRDLQYNCWDCEDVLEAVADADMEDALMDLLEECFNSDVPTLTEVNDLLRFDSEFIYTSLGIRDPYDEDDEEEEDDEDEEELDD